MPLWRLLITFYLLLFTVACETCLIHNYPYPPPYPMKHPLFTLLWMTCLLGLAGCQTAAPPVQLTVAAAADLQFAFTEIATLFEQETGHRVTLVFGSTGQLAQQIENGAPYDVYAAANVEYVDALLAKGLVIEETKTVYAQGHLVLAVNRQAGVAATTLPDLLADEIQRIAIANPNHAPYGRAAQQALQSAGVWEPIQPKLILGENIRQTLQFLQTGDVQVALIARSIADVPDITWVPVDDTLYTPLNQALAVVSRSAHPAEAQALAEFMTGPSARPIMQKYGFVLPDEIAP